MGELTCQLRRTVLAVLACAAPWSGAATPGQPNDATQPSVTPAAPDWLALAAAQVLSPATARGGDLTRQWTAPDGRVVRLVVRLPQPQPLAPAVVVAPPADGEDAGPLLESAVQQVRDSGAGTLRLQPGTYRIAGRPPAPHWLIQGVHDLTVQADGARLQFGSDAPGIVLRTSQRVHLVGATLAYGLRTSSLGTLRTIDGRPALVIDEAHPVRGADRVFQLTEYDRLRRQWVPGGQRLILPPGHASPAVLDGPQTYTSPAFAALQAGRSFAVVHQWYGGAALKIDDSPGPLQAEDIVVERVSIENAPGMGILAYGLKRGMALLSNRIAPAAQGPSPLSTNFDAIHVQSGGGDILIAGNLITGQADDGINLNNPMHPVQRVEDGGRTLVLSTYSRFIQAGDTLAFFDGAGHYLGQSRVAAPPRPLGGLDHRVQLEQAVDGVEAGSLVRDLALLASRFVVEDNTIERCHCHGLLVQLPNGSVHGNTFRDLAYNAVRLLTDLGPWREGVGAINVVVRGNTIADTGPDRAPAMPWAAIAAYGTGRGGTLVDTPVNAHLAITGNRIRRVAQGCITIASSRQVQVSGNECIDTNRDGRRSASLYVLKSIGVRLDGNRTDGAIAVDAASTQDVEVGSAR